MEMVSAQPGDGGRVMKKLMLATATAVCLAAPAMAADIPLKAPPVVPVFTWMGGYVGVNAGYGWANSHDVVDCETFSTGIVVTVSTCANFGSIQPRGGFAGGQAGANFIQWGNFIGGLEVDLQWSDIKDSQAGTVINFLPGGLNATVTSSNKVAWFGTVRPRFGVAWDRLLVYGTGGFAFGRVDHNFNFADNFGFIAHDQTDTGRIGYVVGAGVEYAFWNNLTAKVEYQYIDFGSRNYDAQLFFAPAGPPGIFTIFAEHTSLRTDFHTVRAGLNWKFDYGAPVVAKY
jgi:outer membrane immunogenic protein